MTAWTVLQDSKEGAALLPDLASTKSKKRGREEEEDELIIASQWVRHDASVPSFWSAALDRSGSTTS